MEQRTFEISFGEVQENHFCEIQKPADCKKKSKKKGELETVFGAVFFYIFIYLFAVAFFKIATSASPLPAVSLLL